MSSPYRNNASLILPVRVDETLTLAHRDEQVIHVATALCPFLLKKMPPSCSYSSGDPSTRVNPTHVDKNGNENTLIVRSLDGGLSNTLLVVSNDTDSVLVRIHPPNKESKDSNNTSEIVNRDVDNQISAWLSSEGVAPNYYGRFINGRVEEFYDHFSPLTSLCMPQYAISISKAMANFHNLTVPADICSETIYGELWDRIHSWFELVDDSSYVPNPTDDTDDLLNLSKLRYEFKWLRKELATHTCSSNKPDTMAVDDMKDIAISFCREIVFTHMDCQSLNILTNQDNMMRLIDFEYAGMNPRAADIANTFCEYCDMNNLRADYSKEYPSDKDQDDFLMSYIEVAQYPGLQEAVDTSSSGWETFLESVRVEIRRYTLVSHLGWAVWSIAQSNTSNIEFDYIAYAKQRIEGYYYFKGITRDGVI